MRGRPGTPGDRLVSVRESTLAALGLFYKDEVQGIGFSNEFWNGLGYAYDQMRGQRWIEKVHPEDRERARVWHNGVAAGRAGVLSERFRVVDAAGQWHWVRSAVVVDAWKEDGTPATYLGLDIDDTEHQKLRASLEAAQELAESLAFEAESLRTAGAVIASSLTREEAFSRVVDQLSALVGACRVVALEVREREVVPVTAGASGTDAELAYFTSGDGHAVVLDVLRMRSPTEHRRPGSSESAWVLVPLVMRSEVIGALIVRPLADDDGVDIRLVMAMADYLALALNNARLYERMRSLAVTDQLSGLLTRREFFERAEGAFAHHRAEGTPLSALLVDIDHFKLINDELGHHVGDAAIRAVADTMRLAVREVDIVGRYGGEEFSIVLPETAGDEGLRVAERIRRAIAELDFAEVGRPMTVSIGVAASHGEVEELDNLLQLADQALYRAKRVGRNRVERAGS